MPCVEVHMTVQTTRGFFCLLLAVALCRVSLAVDHVEPTATTRDALVYKDGDKVQGKLLEKTVTEIVFQTDRFGVVRVPVTDAVVIRAEKPALATHAAAPAIAAAPATIAAAESPAAKAAEVREEEEKLSIWERFSPWQLTAKVRNFFGPWHGKLAFATEVVSDTAKRTNN